VSVERPGEDVPRVDDLRQMPAAVKYLSCEPLQQCQPHARVPL
jgi:protein gp37